MTTAANMKSVENATNKEIIARCKELMNAEGEVFAWKESYKEPPLPYRFASIEDAEEHEALKNELLRRRGSSFIGTYETVVYIIGTEKDYQKAVATWEAKKKQQEKKLYFADIDRRVKVAERDIKALEGLKEVCRTFDGKVINCRFNTAVKAATDYYVGFESGLNLHYYDYKNRSSESTIRINTTYLGEIDPYSGKPKAVEPDKWQWRTGDRLEAEKAVLVIDSKINYYHAFIDELQGTKKQYTEYLRKARRVEKLIQELNGYSYYIKNWAKEHDLSHYVSAGNIWRG